MYLFMKGSNGDVMSMRRGTTNDALLSLCEQRKTRHGQGGGGGDVIVFVTFLINQQQ